MNGGHEKSQPLLQGPEQKLTGAEPPAGWAMAVMSWLCAALPRRRLLGNEYYGASSYSANTLARHSPLSSRHIFLVDAHGLHD